MAVLFQPLALSSIIRLHRLHQIPKLWAVVMMDCVRQLMQDNIINNFRRCHDQTPGKTYRAATTA